MKNQITEQAESALRQAADVATLIEELVSQVGDNTVQLSPKALVAFCTIVNHSVDCVMSEVSIMRQ